MDVLSADKHHEKVHQINIFEHFGDSQLLEKPGFEFFGDLFAGLNPVNPQKSEGIDVKEKFLLQLKANQNASSRSIRLNRKRRQQ